MNDLRQSIVWLIGKGSKFNAKHGLNKGFRVEVKKPKGKRSKYFTPSVPTNVICDSIKRLKGITLGVLLGWYVFAFGLV